MMYMTCVEIKFIIIIIMIVKHKMQIHVFLEQVFSKANTDQLTALSYKKIPTELENNVYFVRVSSTSKS